MVGAGEVLHVAQDLDEAEDRGVDGAVVRAEDVREAIERRRDRRCCPGGGSGR
jgi:hypothetical protein